MIIEYPQTSHVGAYRIRPNAPTYPNGNDSKTHPKSSHDKFKTASNAEVCLTLPENIRKVVSFIQEYSVTLLVK